MSEHRKQETTPVSLPELLDEATKELCFFLRGSTLMQSRCRQRRRERTGEAAGQSVTGVVSAHTGAPLRASEGANLEQRVRSTCHITGDSEHARKPIIHHVFRRFCSFYVTSCLVYVTQMHAEAV